MIIHRRRYYTSASPFGGTNDEDTSGEVLGPCEAARRRTAGEFPGRQRAGEPARPPSRSTLAPRLLLRLRARAAAVFGGSRWSRPVEWCM